jgi:hypothetical protein
MNNTIIWLTKIKWDLSGTQVGLKSDCVGKISLEAREDWEVRTVARMGAVRVREHFRVDSGREPTSFQGTPEDVEKLYGHSST